MDSGKLLKILKILESTNPNAAIELEHTNPYTLMIAVVLSAQATDKQVNKITPPIFDLVQTPEDLVNLGYDWFREKINSINYNNTKAKNILSASKILIEKFNSHIPSDMDSLTSLPGVGRKSANVILNSAFNIPSIPVDTHVFRVSNRIGYAEEKTVLAMERTLMKIIPKKYGLLAHHLLVLHGRYICKAVKPKCAECPVEKLCEYEFKLIHEGLVHKSIDTRQRPQS